MADPSQFRPIRSADFAGNPNLFILFRIFFNSRFYYPVYALMFLDFGLTQEHFASLNFAWAVSIVLLEVPSGALADQVGRKPLVIAAAILMTLEMGIMLALPVVDRSAYADDPEGLRNAVGFLFGIFLLNRIVSGAAEAAASGADEAMAYDSLPLDRRAHLWSRLTSRLMKWQAISFILVTLIGAAVYDPSFVNRTLGFLGLETSLTQAQTLKFPIALTLGMSLAVLVIALRMREPDDFVKPEKTHLLRAIRESFARTFRAGAWIAHTPAALMLLLLGLFFDSIIRLYYTVGSIWLRVIGYEPAQLGVISVAGALAGIVAAMIAERLILRRGPGFNFRVLTVLVLVGLLSLAYPIQYWSVLFLPCLWISMRLLHYFLSNYLNRVVDAEKRATVLSFRGLSMNLAYGLLTWLYGLQTAFLRQHRETDPGATDQEVSLAIFADAAQWWWVYFLAVVIGLALFRHFRIRRSWDELVPGAD